MNVEQFWAATPEERVAYVRAQEPHVESQGMLDGSKKVGDYSAVSTMYLGKLGIVIACGWVDTEEEALAGAKEFQDVWDGVLPGERDEGEPEDT